MDEKLRSQLAAGLRESFKHREVGGATCIVCGQGERKVALHVIKYAQNESDPLPEHFVPQSRSYGTIRGGFAICNQCAPACPKCHMPVPKKAVKEAFHRLEVSIHSKSTPISWGNGKCEHTWLFGRWPF